jgi:hypothetical protein
MKQEHLTMKAYEKTQKFSRVFSQFQKEKQAVKDHKDRWRFDNKVKLQQKHVEAQQRRFDNLSQLSLSKQLYTADVNYKGTLAKRDHDNTLMIGR